MSKDDTLAEARPGFNLSRWALEHPALTRYLMVVLMVLGFAAYFQLGQDEDPPFTFRAMVVRVFWPGATAFCACSVWVSALMSMPSAPSCSVENSR